MKKRNVWKILVVSCLLITCLSPSIIFAESSGVIDAVVLGTQSLTPKQWVKNEENLSYFAAMAFFEGLYADATGNTKGLAEKYTDLLFELTDIKEPIAVSNSNDTVYVTFTGKNNQLLISYVPSTKKYTYKFKNKNFTKLNSSYSITLESFVESLDKMFSFFGLSIK